jgi:hypothetical protein
MRIFIGFLSAMSTELALTSISKYFIVFLIYFLENEKPQLVSIDPQEVYLTVGISKHYERF